MVQDGPRIGSLRSSRAVAASGLRVAQVMDALVPWEISSPSNPVGGPWKHWLLGWLEVGTPSCSWKFRSRMSCGSEHV